MNRELSQLSPMELLYRAYAEKKERAKDGKDEGGKTTPAVKGEDFAKDDKSPMELLREAYTKKEA